MQQEGKESLKYDPRLPGIEPSSPIIGEMQSGHQSIMLCTTSECEKELKKKTTWRAPAGGFEPGTLRLETPCYIVHTRAAPAPAPQTSMPGDETKGTLLIDSFSDYVLHTKRAHTQHTWKRRGAGF